MLIIKALNKATNLIEEIEPGQWYNLQSDSNYQYVGTIYKSDDQKSQLKKTQSAPTPKRGCGCGKKK